MRILAISGRKRSGKDTCANLLQQSEKVKVYSYAFALPIKQAIHAAYEKLEYWRRSGQTLSFADINGETSYDRESPLIISNTDTVELLQEALNWLSVERGLEFKASTASAVLMAIERKCKDNKQPWNIRRLMQMLGTDIVCNMIDKHFWSYLMMVEYFKVLRLNHGFNYFLITDVRHIHEADLIRNMGAQIIFVERPDVNSEQTDSHISEQGIVRLDGEPLIINNGTKTDLLNKLLEVI